MISIYDSRLFDSMRDHQLGHRRIDAKECNRYLLFYRWWYWFWLSSCNAYMLKDLARMVGTVTIGVSVLPTVFEDKAGVNKDGIFANGYAALKETEHL